MPSDRFFDSSGVRARAPLRIAMGLVGGSVAMSSSTLPLNAVLIWLMLAWPGVGARKPVL